MTIMKEAKKTITNYIVEYKQRYEPDTWCKLPVTLNSRTNKRMTTLEEAKYEIERLKRRDAAARQRGYSTDYCGGFGVSVAHYSDYDIIAFRIRKREVTPYETVCEEVVE